MKYSINAYPKNMMPITFNIGLQLLLHLGQPSISTKCVYSYVYIVSLALKLYPFCALTQVGAANIVCTP
jgi:hypothetical protein